MKILIYGSGNAREHATHSKLQQEASVEKLGFLLYGRNPFIENHEGTVLVSNLSNAIEKAREFEPDLILVLSPGDLIDGVAEVFEENGFKVFGVDSKLARLEGSKSYSKLLMNEGSVPTPFYRVYNDYERAKKALERNWGEHGLVIKTDRFLMNANDRVVVPSSLEEAHQALQSAFFSPGMQKSGYVILEDRIAGPEYSLHILVDQHSHFVMPIVQDYKKRDDDNFGPNTEGIGAIATTAADSKALLDAMEKELVIPAIEAIRQEGIYRSILYIGVMHTANGLQCLEFNVRAGNPEWVVLLQLMKSSFSELALAIAEDRLGDFTKGNKGIEFYENSEAAVVMACQQGYPLNENLASQEIRIPEQLTKTNPTDDLFFVADHIQKVADLYETSGGRVLGVSARENTLAEAVSKCYQTLGGIHFAGKFHRTDIGKKDFSYRWSSLS